MVEIVLPSFRLILPRDTRHGRRPWKKVLGIISWCLNRAFRAPLEIQFRFWLGAPFTERLGYRITWHFPLAGGLATADNVQKLIVSIPERGYQFSLALEDLILRGLNGGARTTYSIAYIFLCRWSCPGRSTFIAAAEERERAIGLSGTSDTSVG